MKLTWFGGTALRIHIGGRILVCDARSAAAGVSQAELTAGADTSFERNHGKGTADPMKFQRRRRVAVIDEEGADAEVLVHDFGLGATLIDAVGEPPLAIYGHGLMFAGRWEQEAVVVVFNAIDAINALSDMHPRIMVLAFDDFSLQVTIDSLRDRLDGTGLFALERGMALEV